jgi:cytoskeletal protein CcmA (bactofilin family)
LSPASQLNTVFGPDAHYEGDLAVEGRVRIDGHYAGRIYTEDCLEVGATGVLEGEADVARAVVAGRVEGRLRVRESLVVEPSGCIVGSLDAGEVELRPGARLEGEVRIVGRAVP